MNHVVLGQAIPSTSLANGQVLMPLSGDSLTVGAGKLQMNPFCVLLTGTHCNSQCYGLAMQCNCNDLIGN